MGRISIRRNMRRLLRTLHSLWSWLLLMTVCRVRAAINLEAAGTTGRDLLFQATSEQMIEAYSHVPRYVSPSPSYFLWRAFLYFLYSYRPFGTILANEIFSSGVILSDTDFRQFEQYLNVTGLDMAIVGNSYLYHMRKVRFLPPPHSVLPPR